MPIRSQVFIIFFSLLLMFFVFALLRRRKISETITLWWLLVICLVIYLTFDKSLLNTIKDVFGVALPISALLLLSFVFVLMMLIYFSMRISVMQNQIKELTQHLALLKAELLERLKKE